MKLKLFFFAAFLSATAHLLALCASFQMQGLGMENIVVSEDTTKSLVFFLLFFFTATIFFLLLFHFTKGTILYRIIFSAVIFLGLLKLFELVFPFGFSSVLALVFLGGFFLVPSVWTHDVIVILASAGISSLLSIQFSEETAALLLIILSVYDGVAVFITQHMIVLVHEMIRRQATFALFIPERARDFGANISTVKPGAGFLILGGGDLVLPMIAISVVGRSSIVAALYGIAGALSGLFVNHLFITFLRKPIPALPALTAGVLIGIQIGHFFT